MLQSIRNKSTSWFALAIIFMALFALTFFGIGDYFTTRTDTFVARVGDQEIDQNQYRQRFQNFRQDMRQRMGEAYDPRMVDQPMFRRQVLDEMVDEALLLQANERLGLVVPASRLRNEIARVPQFQVGGQFDQQTYVSLLAAQGMSPGMYERRAREQLAVRTLPAAAVQSILVTDAEIDAHVRLSEQARDFRFLRVSEPAEPVPEEITEEQRQAFYDANSAEFMTPETVTIEYVEIKADELNLASEPDEGELRARYETEKARFGTPEQRLASHILVRAEGADADAQRDALTRAEALAGQARAEGADFAALAREHSADLGSREEGGDLGWVERGQTDPAFEDGLFGLAEGEVSDPVRSDEGYHVIVLRELREATQQSFDEVRERLAEEYLSSERERLFGERSGELLDLIYEDPGSLATAVDALGLELHTVGPFRRDSRDGVFANPAVRTAAFSDEVLLERTVSDMIDIGDGHRIAIRVAEHEPSAPRPLTEVAAEIDRRIGIQRRAEAIEAHAEALFARWQDGEALEDLAAELGGEVETAPDTGRSATAPDQSLVAAVFRMPRPQAAEPVRRQVPIGGGHALVELTSVVDGEPATIDDERRVQVRAELEQSRARAEIEALVASLRAQAEIVVVEDRLR